MSNQVASRKTKFVVDVKKLATDLQKHREDKNLTMIEAGEEMGLSASTVHRLINGFTKDADTLVSAIHWMEGDLNSYVVSRQDLLN
jgi:transcriptional regulator with XRE-family HTH domain